MINCKQNPKSSLSPHPTRDCAFRAFRKHNPGSWVVRFGIAGRTHGLPPNLHCNSLRSRFHSNNRCAGDEILGGGPSGYRRNFRSRILIFTPIRIFRYKAQSLQFKRRRHRNFWRGSHWVNPMTPGWVEGLPLEDGRRRKLKLFLL